MQKNILQKKKIENTILSDSTLETYVFFDK